MQACLICQHESKKNIHLQQQRNQNHSDYKKNSIETYGMAPETAAVTVVMVYFITEAATALIAQANKVATFRDNVKSGANDSWQQHTTSKNTGSGHNGDVHCITCDSSGYNTAGNVILGILGTTVITVAM